MSGSCREALSYVREYQGGLPVSTVVFRRPSRMSESGREVIPDVRE